MHNNTEDTASQMSTKQLRTRKRSESQKDPEPSINSTEVHIGEVDYLQGHGKSHKYGEK